MLINFYYFYLNENTWSNFKYPFQFYFNKRLLIKIIWTLISISDFTTTNKNVWIVQIFNSVHKFFFKLFNERNKQWWNAMQLFIF